MIPMTRITIIVAIRPGAHELSVGRQQEAQGLALGDDHEELTGHQAAPREGPALLEPGGERREGGGQDHMAVGREALRSQHPSRSA